MNYGPCFIKKTKMPGVDFEHKKTLVNTHFNNSSMILPVQEGIADGHYILIIRTL